MKTLLLIRHAKSSWELPGTPDFDRPLNDRGKADAPEMARRLVKSKIQIDCFIASPAKRTKRTAELFIREFKKDEKEILFEPVLYAGGEESFFEVISHLDDTCATAAIFSHNPAITEFANSLTDMRLDNIPTCGIFGVTSPVENWKGFAGAKKNFLFFDYPKAR
jgi:phosphohistidine phosphatase